MKIALINMPVSQQDVPSLGLSLLKSELNQHGISSDIYYLNNWFAELIDPDLYDSLARGEPMVHDLSAEWLFVEALWGTDQKRDRDYLSLVASGKSQHHRKNWSDDKIQEHVANLIEARKAVDKFIERCVYEIDWSNYQIIGFTSVFQQQIASLALAKHIKHIYPESHIIFGGANCESIMGSTVLRTFPFVDAVCLGEGDKCFPNYAKKIFSDCGVSNVVGIIQRSLGQVITSGDPSRMGLLQFDLSSDRVSDLNELPYPDFDDYFAQRTCVANKDKQPYIIFETSRGCWWGERSHCTFCGLNGDSMKFRQKTSTRALEELQWIIRRYGKHTRKILASDNIIPYNFLQDFLPKVNELGLNIELFYESKANLTKKQVRLYKEAGINNFQPGIESLSTPILKIMQKGTSGIQNVQLLKWCREFGLTPSWNYLIGFPEEKPEHYNGQDDWIRIIQHLTPPSYCGPIRFDRFSPYLVMPTAFGISDLSPYPSYKFIYPELSEEELFDISYFFTGKFKGQEEVNTYTESLRKAIFEWQLNNGKTSLFSIDYGKEVIVYDNRKIGKESVHVLSGIEKLILEHCDSVISRHTLLNLTKLNKFGPTKSESINKVLDKLSEMDLLLWEDDRCLSVVVPLATTNSA